MNNTFSFNRFRKYFRYDLKRWVASFGPTLLLMSAVPVILYTFIAIYSLLFSGQWDTPGETTRIVASVITTVVMVLIYPASVYGYITDKKAGSSFLMIPASVPEKFLSMLLNTIFVVPLTFGLIYLSLDGIICAIDGSCGGSLFKCVRDGVNTILTFPFSSDAPVSVSLFSMWIHSAGSALFFLLGALFFKKHKILYPLLIIVGLQMFFSILFGIVISLGLIDIDSFGLWTERIAEQYLSNPDFLGWAIPAFNILATLWDILVFAAFATAVYFRLKTIKH